VTIADLPANAQFLKLNIDDIQKLISRYDVMRKGLDRAHPRRVAMAVYLLRLFTVITKRIGDGAVYLDEHRDDTRAALFLDELMLLAESLNARLEEDWDESMQIGFLSHLFGAEGVGYVRTEPRKPGSPARPEAGESLPQEGA